MSRNSRLRHSMAAFPNSTSIMALSRRTFLICLLGWLGIGSGSSIASESSSQSASSYSAPMAVVGIMASPAGSVAAERRDAAWDAWADLEVNAPHLVGLVKCVFVVGHVDAPSLAAWKKRNDSSSSNGTRNPAKDDGNSDDNNNSHFEEHGTFDGKGRADLPTLTVPVIDAYNRVIDKLLYLCRWVVYATDARFVIKVDDDTFLRLPLLLQALHPSNATASSALAAAASAAAVPVYYGQFCTGAATRVPGHKNYVPARCYALSSYPPYAHGGAYALSRDLVTYLANNADVFAPGTINRCIERVCNTPAAAHDDASSETTAFPGSSSRNDLAAARGDWWRDPRWLDESCANVRGELPSLEDVQVALWLLPFASVAQRHDHRLISAGSCHSDAVAIWDLPPSIMRHLGNTLRRYESHIFKHTSNCAEGSDKKSDSDSSNSCSNTSGSENKGSITPQPETTLCTPTLMGFAADSFANSSLTSVFGKSGSHQHPMNHQVYSLYYTYFFLLVRASRWRAALQAWSTALAWAPDAASATQLLPLANFIKARLKPRESATASSDNNGDDINDCPGCAETLAPVLNGMSTNQGRAVEVCSSVSGNVDSLEPAFKDLAKHIRSEF